MKKRIEQLIISILICLFPLSAMTEEIFFYHTDNFGTPMAMTDTNGGVVWRADELPFGEEYQPPEEIPEQNNRRFLGKELDKETGLTRLAWSIPLLARLTRKCLLILSGIIGMCMG